MQINVTARAHHRIARAAVRIASGTSETVDASSMPSSECFTHRARKHCKVGNGINYNGSKIESDKCERMRQEFQCRRKQPTRCHVTDFPVRSCAPHCTLTNTVV